MKGFLGLGFRPLYSSKNDRLPPYAETPETHWSPVRPTGYPAVWRNPVTSVLAGEPRPIYGGGGGMTFRKI